MIESLAVLFKTYLGKVFSASVFSTIARCAFSKHMGKKDCFKFFIVSIFVVFVALSFSGYLALNSDLERIVIFVSGFVAREIAEFVLALIQKLQQKQGEFIDKFSKKL